MDGITKCFTEATCPIFRTISAAAASVLAQPSAVSYTLAAHIRLPFWIFTRTPRYGDICVGTGRGGADSEVSVDSDVNVVQSTFPCAICGRTQTQHDACMDSDLQSNIIKLGSRPGVPPLPHAGRGVEDVTTTWARRAGTTSGCTTSRPSGRRHTGVSKGAWGDANTPCALPSLQMPGQSPCMEHRGWRGSPTEAEVRRARRLVALKVHPDKHP